jgi:YD repeat-containing protein
LDPSAASSGDPNLMNLIKMTSPTGVISSYNFTAKVFDDGPQFTPVVSVSLQSKTVSGGDVTAGTWSYAYDTGSNASNSVTTITTPAGIEKHTFFSSKQANSGEVWRIGSLQQQQWLSGSTLLKQVDYVWEKDYISSMRVNSRRRGLSTVFDPDTWAPRLAQRNTSINASGGNLQFATNYQNYDAFGNAQKIVETGYDQGSVSTRTRVLTFDVKTAPWILRLVSSEKFDDDARTISRTYNNTGRLTQDNQFGVITQYSRCANGEVEEMTNANGHETRYGCDYQHGIPTREERVSDPISDSVTLTRSVDDAGRITSESILSAYPETDGSFSALTTAYTWDSLNRLKSISTPERGDKNISITWSDDGRTRTLKRGDYQQIQQTDGMGNIIKQTYDDLSQSLRYDALGRKTFTSNLGSTTVGTNLSYDAIHRQLVIDPPGNGQISYSYLKNNETRITDQVGNNTTYSYRAYDANETGLLTRIDNGTITLINRDVWGLMTRVQQAGVTRSYQYNSKQQLTQITHPEIGEVIFGRDAIGNLISLDVGDVRTQYTYNALEQLSAINYTDPNTPDETRTYTKTGQLSAAITNGYFRWDYRYTRNDQLSQEKLTYLAGSPINSGAAKTFTLTYRYNDQDHVSQMIYPSGINYQYDYDALGRPVQLHILNGQYLIQAAQYWPNGQLQQLVYGNNKSTRFEQNAQLKISSVKTGDADLTDNNPNDGFTIVNTIAQEAYTYNGKGLLTALNDPLQPTFGFSSLGYDRQDRLTHLNNVEVFRYDGQHNMTYNNIGGRNFSYSYDANQRLTQISNSPYSQFLYDARGNVRSNGKDNFVYDEANRLRSITNPVNDPLNNRNWRLFYDSQGQRTFQLKDGKATYSFYGRNGKLLFERDEQTQQQRDYLYLGNQMVSKIAAAMAP